MRVVSVQSPNQRGISSSPEGYAKNEFLGFMMPWSMIPAIPAQGEFIKDGRKLLLRLARDGDGVATWLRVHTGLTVTVAIPHLGLAWSPTLSYRRTQRYFYVRIPASLKKFLMPFWQSGLTIPVVIMIPPIALTSKVAEVVGYGKQ
jgi:hypothetical protein